MDSVSSTTGTELTRVRHILGLMQKNLECPICLDLLKNPVSTRCNHQFCRFCILKALTGKQSVSCPLCKEEVTKRSLQDNSQLQQIITAVQSVTEAVYKDTGQQKAPPVGSSQNCRKAQDQKEQGEKRRHISTDSEEGNGIPSTVQVRNRRNIRQAKRRRVEETPVYIEEDPVEDNSAPRTSTNINISCGFPVQELSKGRKNRNVTDSPDRENHGRRRTRHAARRDGRSSNRDRGSGQLEQTVASTELLSALVENSLGVSGDGHVTNSCHGDDDVTGNADPSAEGDRLLHVLGEASLGLLGQSTENIGDPVAVCNSGVPKTEAQVGDKPLLSSHGHNADEGSREDDQKSDTLGPTVSEAEPLDISKEQEQMTVDLLTTEDKVPADIGTAVRVKEKVEFWLKHHSLHQEVNNKSDTEPVGMDELDPYEFIGSQQDPAKEKKKPKIRVKKVRKPAAAGKRNQKTPTTTKMSSGPSKGKPGKSSAKQVEEVDGGEEEYEEQDQEVSSAASMTDGSEASWKPGQSDPDWGKGRTSRRKSAETKADEESVSSKGRRRKQTRAVDNEDQLTVSSGSSSQLRIDRWVQRKEKVFVKSYSKPALSRREKRLLQKKTEGLEEQWRRAKNMAGDFSAKVLHPIAEELPSRTKKKSKNKDTPLEVPVEETIIPQPDSPEKPSMGRREEVQNSDDDMCVYLTSNGELLNEPNSPEDSDGPTEDPDPEKQPAKEKSVALTDQEQKIAADLNELDEQTFSQLGMFSQQYLQKRKRRKDRKKRFEEEQDKDEDNIFAAIRALEGESNLCNNEDQDETSRKEAECMEVEDNEFDQEDHIPEVTGTVTVEKTISSKSQQARSLSRDHRGKEDVTEEEARPRRTRSSTRKGTEDNHNLEKIGPKNVDLPEEVGNIGSKESLGQAPSTSKAKSGRKRQDEKGDRKSNSEEPSGPDYMEDKCDDVTQDANDHGNEGVSKKPEGEKGRQQSATKEKKTTESSKEPETRQEDSVNIGEAVTKEKVSCRKTLQTRKRHAAEEQTNMKPIGNVTESLGVRETRHSKTSEKRSKDDPKHLPLVTTKDKVPQDPYQFQCSQDCGGKKRAGKKRGRRQRGKVKKLKRTKARKRELLLIKAGWMEKEEDGEELDESEEESVQESVNKNNDKEEMVDEIHMDECKDAQTHLDKQEGGDQDTIPPEERINNTEVSVVPESNPNTQDTCIPSKRQGVVDLTASQPSYPVEDTPGIYSTEIIPPSLEEHQTKSPQAGKNKKKKKKTGEVSKLSTSGKVVSQDTEDSEDIIGPSWQEKEQKQPRDKLNNKPENVQSPEEVQNIRRSPRHSPKNASAKEREEDARSSVRHSSEKDKDGQQDILNSPRRRPRKTLEEQDLRRSPRHSTRKSLAGVIDAEQNAEVSPRHSPEKDKNEQKQNERSSPRHSDENALDQDKAEEEEMRKIPTHGTEKQTDKRKNKTGKQNLQPSSKEKRTTLQDFGNVVRNIPDTIMLASPSPPRRNFAGVASNTRSHRTGEERVSDPTDEEEIFSSPGTQDTSIENSMEDCVAIPESETATEFEGKLVEVVADVHRLAEFSEGSQRTQTQNKLRKVLSEVQSPGQHTSQRTPASLHSSGKDSTPGEVPPTPGEMFPTPPPPSTPLRSSGQKAAADRNRLSTRRRRSQLRSPESTPSDHVTSPQNTPSTPDLLKSAAAGTKSTKSCATPTVPPDAVDSGKETPKSCPPESDVSTHCSQRTTQSDYREHLDSNVVPDSEENVSRKGKRRSSSMQNTSNSEASPKMKVTSPSTMLQQSFPDSGNTEASVSLLENVKLQTKGAETVSKQKRKSPRLSREVSDIDKNENSSREVTQKLEQTKAEETNSGSHLKEQTRGGKGEGKPDNMEPTENVVATQATFNGQGQKSEENEDQDLAEEVKQNVQVENNEQEIEDAQEEDGTEDEEDDDSEEEDLVPPTPPDTSFTHVQLTQRTMTVKSKPRIPERFDVQENNRQPVIIEEEENRECGWSDDDEDELPDLDDNHQVSPKCHSNTATPKNRSEKQPDVKEAVKESQDDISQATDTDINTHSQSKRRKETSAVLDVKDEATEESLSKRRKSEGNTEPESENKRNPIADAFDVTACLENNEESDLSQDSHAHDLTNASTLSELYDTQHQDKLKNDVQHLEGQMAMIQMLLAKGKERAREKEKEENNSEEQHLTTVHEENMQVSEGDQEEILSGKDLYGTPSSQASAKDIYSTSQEGTTPKKLRSSSTPTETNHSPTKEYNFRKRVSSPQRSQEASVKSQKSRRSQSSPRSSQPCLSPRSPSPPPTFSPEKTRASRTLPPAIQAAASLLEKFKSPNVEGKKRNSGNSTPLGKDDATERRLSPRVQKGSTSSSDRKNTTPRSSISSKKSNSILSPRKKKQRDLVQDEDRGDDALPVEDIAPTVVKNRRSLNRKKSNSLKDVFSDEEDHTVTRCEDVPPASDGDENHTPTSGELRDDVCEPEEVSTNWKAFQQMKCDILAQKGPSPSKRQNKEAPKRLSLPTTQKSDKSSSDKRKSEPAIPSSQFDRNDMTEKPSTPQPRKTPLTFSQQPSPSVRKPFQSVPSKKDSPRIHSSYKLPTDRTPKENTERMTSTPTVKSTDSAAGQTTGVKNEWQEKNHVPMTFVTTGLSKEETRAVHELAKKTGSRVKQTFDNSTTHVITRTDVDLFCSRTLKFFLGIAGRKWIVSFQWISACLEEGKHVPEEPFEVRGDLVHGCHGGPRQARNNKGKLLLSNYEICIYGKFTALTRDDLQFMVELCGGTVIKEPHMFPHDKKPLIVSQVDANQLTEEDYNAFYRRYGVLSVTRDWILDSVSSYQVQPINRYLMCSTQNQNVIVID